MDELVGQRIRKAFGQRVFWGHVLALYHLAGVDFYKVYFDDGDVDILTREEALQHIDDARKCASDDRGAFSYCSPKYIEETRVILRKRKHQESSKETNDSATNTDESTDKESDREKLYTVTVWGQRLYAVVASSGTECAYISGFTCTADGETGELESTGKVRIGDVIVAVNGKAVRGLNSEKIQALIVQGKRPMRLTFTPPKNHPIDLPKVIPGIPPPKPVQATSASSSVSERPSSISTGPVPSSSISSSVTSAVSNALPTQASAPLTASRSVSTTTHPVVGAPISQPPQARSATSAPSVVSIPVSKTTQPVVVSRVSQPTQPGSVPLAGSATTKFAVGPPVSQPSQATQFTVQPSRATTTSQYASRSITRPGQSWVPQRQQSTNPAALLTRTSLQPSAANNSNTTFGSSHPNSTNVGFGSSKANATSVVFGVNQQLRFVPSFGATSMNAQPYSANALAQHMKKYHEQLLQQRAPAVPSAASDSTTTTYRSEQSAPTASVAPRWVIAPTTNNVPVSTIGSQRHDHTITVSQRGSFISPTSSYATPNTVNQPQSMINQVFAGPRQFDARTVIRSTVQARTAHANDPTASNENHAINQNQTPHEATTPPHRPENENVSPTGSEEAIEIEALDGPSTDATKSADTTGSSIAPNQNSQDHDMTQLESQQTHSTSSKTPSKDQLGSLNELENSFLSPNQKSFAELIPADKKSSTSTAFDGELGEFSAAEDIVIRITLERLYVTLGTVSGRLAVTSFASGQNGERGEIEQSGKVFVGDLLVGINDNKFSGSVSPMDVAHIVSSIPRPFTVVFRRASWDMLNFIMTSDGKHN